LKAAVTFLEAGERGKRWRGDGGQALIERSLNFALSNEVKRQDKIDVVQRAAENPYVRMIGAG